MADTQRYVTCQVEKVLVGVEADIVQEVTASMELTPVPFAPPAVAGLLNLRGNIVTAIDLRRCLDLTERAADEDFLNLIVKTEDGFTSLLVDRVGDLIEVDGRDLGPLPVTLSGPLRELSTGVHEVAGRLLLVLDTRVVLERSASDVTTSGG